MYLLGFLVIIVVGYLIFSKRSKATTTKNSGSAKKRVLSNSSGGGNSFLPPIPAGYQIFEKNLPVAGIQFRKIDAISFAKSSGQELGLERQSNNEHDPNAIKLIGISGSTRYFIGSLPKELSKQIILTGLYESVKPRLVRIYIGQNDFLDIQYQIIGPKTEKKNFDAYLSAQPAHLSQKEFYKFFELPMPKGLTAGQAGLTISEHSKNCKPEELAEWNGYINILEEFEDNGFRESYDLKKVSKAALTEALNALKQEGKSYSYLSESIDEVVDKVILLKPALEKST